MRRGGVGRADLGRWRVLYGQPVNAEQRSGQLAECVYRSAAAFTSRPRSITDDAIVQARIWGGEEAPRTPWLGMTSSASGRGQG